MPTPYSSIADDDRGATEPFLEAAGDDADDARVPAGPADDDDAAVGRDHRIRLDLDAALYPAACFVERVELGGERVRLVGIAGGEQAHAEVGFADAPARVDPRAEREAQGRCRSARG